ncbi:hypothetical protein Aduo_001631 [Ancylostoma duodenale]
MLVTKITTVLYHNPCSAAIMSESELEQLESSFESLAGYLDNAEDFVAEDIPLVIPQEDCSDDEDDDGGESGGNDSDG